MHNRPAASLQPAIPLPVFLLPGRLLMPSAVITLHRDLALPAEDGEVDPVPASLFMQYAELVLRVNPVVDDRSSQDLFQGRDAEEFPYLPGLE